MRRVSLSEQYCDVKSDDMIYRRLVKFRGIMVTGIYPVWIYIISVVDRSGISNWPSTLAKVHAGGQPCLKTQVRLTCCSLQPVYLASVFVLLIFLAILHKLSIQLMASRNTAVLRYLTVYYSRAFLDTAQPYV